MRAKPEILAAAGRLDAMTFAINMAATYRYPRRPAVARHWRLAAVRRRDAPTGSAEPVMAARVPGRQNVKALSQKETSAPGLSRLVAHQGAGHGHLGKFDDCSQIAPAADMSPLMIRYLTSSFVFQRADKPPPRVRAVPVHGYSGIQWSARICAVPPAESG